MLQRFKKSMFQMLQILQNVANVSHFFLKKKGCQLTKRLSKMAPMMQSIQNVSNVANLQSVANVAEVNFRNVAYAVELSKCCRDINKCCKCVGFLKTQGDFALLHLCLELIKTICSLLCSLSICHFGFAAVLTIRSGSVLCYVDTAEMLTFRESDKCVFCPYQH